jgi:peptidyl-prolyl cis-trans isomerase D
MIKTIRNAGSSFAVWLILGVLAVAFGLSFGLPSDSLTVGTAAFANAYGDEVRREDWTYQMQLVASYVGIPEDESLQELQGVKEEVLDSIIERKVLVEAADEIGLAADQRDAELLTRDGHLILLGYTVSWLGQRKFNYENGFKRHLANFATSETEYLKTQSEEVLARTVRDMIMASTVIPEDELRRTYDEAENQISLRYVRFENRNYAVLVDPTEAEIEAYMNANADQLRERLESQRPRFTKLPPQVRLRFISLQRPPALPAGADEAALTQWKTDDAVARSRAQTVLDRINGGEAMRDVARELSVDGATARAGGDFGWIPVEGSGVELDPALLEAARGETQANELMGPIEGADRYFVLRVEGKREGDVPETEALQELAVEALRTERGKDLAKQAAEEALLSLRGGKQLNELFTPAPVLPTGGLPIEEVGAPANDDGIPHLAVTGLFARGKPIPGLGAIPGLADAAWTSGSGDAIIDQVFTTPSGTVIAAVDDRREGSDDGFQAARGELYAALVQQKAGRTTAFFAKYRCREARGRGDIMPNETAVGRLMVYDSDSTRNEQGVKITKPYNMCDRVGSRGGLLNATPRP